MIVMPRQTPTVDPQEKILRIQNNDVIKEIRDVAGIGGQYFDPVIKSQVRPVLVMNPDGVNASLTGDIAATNSTTTNKTTLEVNNLVEADDRSLVRFGTSRSGQSVTAGTPVTMYTVTAGKTLYLTFLSLGRTSGGSVELLASGTTIGSINTNGAVNNSQLALNGQTPIKFTSGQTVQIDVDAGTITCHVLGVGWEE